VKTTAALSLTLFLALCAADHVALAQQGPAPDPAAEAKAIEVSEYATVKKVRGVCHRLRGEEMSDSFRIGEVLEPGDILDLGTNCVLTVAVESHKTRVLDARHGRYFRIEKG
jgi:hypothetical protein